MTLTSPHGEVHDYEVEGSVVRLAGAKTFAEAKRKLGGAMLRSINPRRRTARKSRARLSKRRTSARRSTKSRARKSTKSRSRRSTRARRTHARR